MPAKSQCSVCQRYRLTTDFRMRHYTRATKHMGIRHYAYPMTECRYCERDRINARNRARKRARFMAVCQTARVR